MKRLKFRYEMELKFSQDVSDHHFRFQCLPARDPFQEQEELTYEITPSCSVSEISDGFGNLALWGEALKPHDSLKVKCKGIVRVDNSMRPSSAPHPLFRFPSAYTAPEDNIRDLHKQLLGQYVKKGGDPGTLDIFLAIYLMQGLRERFFYVPGVTGTATTASEALGLRKGVCQDYAHILVSLCRMSGFYARYVAGAMVGEGATHAWTEVWLGDHWAGLDGANGRLADERYIRFSAGRDFGDCTVDRGCFKGFAGQTQNIFVKVEEMI